MIGLEITVDEKDTQRFLVNVKGAVRNRKALNTTLGKALARTVKKHFRAKNKTPNRLGGRRTNFWSDIGESMAQVVADERRATVTIEDRRFAVHLFGGTIKPTGSRRFLTIPLVKEAHGLRTREYERQSGNKLFRPGHANVLIERSGQGDRSTIGATTAAVRGRGGFRAINVPARTRTRAVYALKRSVNIPKDPSALPPADELLKVLTAAGNDYLAREARKKGGRA